MPAPFRVIRVFHGSSPTAAGSWPLRPSFKIEIKMFAFTCTNTNNIVMKTNRYFTLNRFVFLYFSLLAAFAHGQQILPPRYFYPNTDFDHFTTNRMVVKNTIGKETPVAMAIWVPGKAHEYGNPLSDDEIQKLNWQPFKSEVLVDLGPGPGKRNVWLVAKWENPTEFQQKKLGLTVDAEMPYVVITNPTHVAVALRYKEGEDDAPKIVAKGINLMAEKVKDIARANSVIIVENPPLARTLVKLEVGWSVPPELFQAVAEILAFVYQAKGKIRLEENDKKVDNSILNDTYIPRPDIGGTL